MDLFLLKGGGNDDGEPQLPDHQPGPAPGRPGGLQVRRDEHHRLPPGRPRPPRGRERGEDVEGGGDEVPFQELPNHSAHQGFPQN